MTIDSFASPKRVLTTLANGALFEDSPYKHTPQQNRLVTRTSTIACHLDFGKVGRKKKPVRHGSVYLIYCASKRIPLPRIHVKQALSTNKLEAIEELAKRELEKISNKLNTYGATHAYAGQTCTNRRGYQHRYSVKRLITTICSGTRFHTSVASSPSKTHWFRTNIFRGIPCPPNPFEPRRVLPYGMDAVEKATIAALKSNPQLEILNSTVGNSTTEEQRFSFLMAMENYE